MLYLWSVINHKKTNIMKNLNTQKFFTVTLNFTDFNHKWDRNLIESFLQHFFNSELKGKELANSIGIKTLSIKTIDSDISLNFFKKNFAVIKIEGLC